jgi:hypothetical protein
MENDMGFWKDKVVMITGAGNHAGYRNGVSIFHLPFLIFHFSFICTAPASMTNEKWQTKNGK